jgi:aspartyl/asparaginyl beta-hydroxylase (cupin superfamily)
MAGAEDAVALNSRGMAALAAGEPATAAAHFAAAAALDPQAIPLWMNLATAHRQMADDAGEVAALDRALAIDVRHLMALIRKAELCERTGRLTEAARLWGGAIAVAPPREDLPPALVETLARAQWFVTSRTQALGAAVDEALHDMRTALGGEATRRFDAAIDATLGRRRIYSNECAGLHVPFLPADEFFPRAHFPWLADLEARTPAIRAEIADLLATGAEGFAPYVAMDPGTPANKWTPLDNSLDWAAYYLWKYGEPVAAAQARCPATTAALAAIPRVALPGRAPTAFFSVLKPGARIPPHTGVSNVRSIVHLALIVPDGCGFRVGGEVRRWREGEAFVFDDTIEHEAWNDSDQLRAVLIFDVWNPHLTEAERELLPKFYEAADASGQGGDDFAGG